MGVRSPAGSGKTTLVSSYLDARKLPCLWYRLDEGDSDAASFFYYMGMAAQKLFPKRKPLPHLTPEYLMGVPTFRKRYFESLCSRLKPPHLIVFDNFHDVPPDSPFHEMIVHAVYALPESITVAVLSRNEPPPQFIRLHANSKMRCFGWDDIRLNLAETQDITKRIFKGRRLPDEDLKDIYVKTSGWAAGLVLMIASLKRSLGSAYPVSGKLAPQEIFDYFSNELFDTLDASLRQFFLRTAFLPRMTAAIAERLTNNPRTGQILHKLSNNNYFTERHLKDHPVFVYHPLFRDFLLSQTQGEMQPSEIREIQITAARVLADEGQLEDAAELFIEAGDMEGLINLILTTAESFASQGRFHTLEEWLDKVPPEMHNAVPWLHFWKGACRQTASFTESRTNFEVAFKLFVALDDKAGMLVSWCNIVDALLFEGGDFTMLDRWVDWMEGYVSKGGTYPSLDIEAQVATAMAGAYVWRRPGHPECKRWVERALQLTAGGHNFLQIKAQTSAVLYYLWVGDFARSKRLAEDAAAIASLKGVSSLLKVAAKCQEAWAYEAHGEYHERAFQCVLEGLEIAERTGISAYRHLLNIHGVYTSFSLGNMDKAGEFLEALGHIVNSNQISSFAQYKFLAAWFNLLIGRISQAYSLAEEAVSLVAASGTPFPEVFVRHVAALIKHEMGEYKEADEMLSKASEIALQINSPFLIYLCLLDEAQFAFDRRNESAGLEAIQKALEIGGKHELTTTAHYWRLPVLSRLFAKALEAGIETDYVKRFIKKCRLLPDDKSLDSEHWPRPIKVYTLGRFSVMKDEEPIKFGGKVQQRPLSMIKAVIAFGGREVHEDRIIDALWPEADGDVAHSSLRTTVHRFRQLLSTTAKFLSTFDGSQQFFSL